MNLISLFVLTILYKPATVQIDVNSSNAWVYANNNQFGSKLSRKEKKYSRLLYNLVERVCMDYSTYGSRQSR